MAGVRHRFISAARARQYRSFSGGIGAVFFVPICCHSGFNLNCDCEDIHFMAERLARWSVGCGHYRRSGVWSPLALGGAIYLGASAPFEMAVYLSTSRTGSKHLDCVGVE